MERPIIFSTPMVQAILEGRKTMTRRIVKFPKGWIPEDNAWDWVALSDFYPKWKCPYGVVGDLLWVREAWAVVSVSNGTTARQLLKIFKADDVDVHIVNRWKPSIHMSRAASRITLRITNIRLELLQTISINDVEKEGIKPGVMMFIEFSNLWEKINGIGSWQKHTWVWVIEFERVQA